MVDRFGFCYYQHSLSALSNQVSWKCSRSQSGKCSCLAFTNGNKIIKLQSEHNHLPPLPPASSADNQNIKVENLLNHL